MSPIKKDPQRDERITNEIVMDANGPEEQAMGWHYYLEDTLHFPRSRCGLALLDGAGL